MHARITQLLLRLALVLALAASGIGFDLAPQQTMATGSSMLTVNSPMECSLCDRMNGPAVNCKVSCSQMIYEARVETAFAAIKLHAQLFEFQPQRLVGIESTPVAPPS